MVEVIHSCDYLSNWRVVDRTARLGPPSGREVNNMAPQIFHFKKSEFVVQKFVRTGIALGLIKLYGHCYDPWH